MCLLLSQNFSPLAQGGPDKILTKAMFSTIFATNPHGAGVGYYNDKGEPVICVALTLMQAWKNYRKAVYKLTSSTRTTQRRLLVHMRIATQGSKTYNNCHPFFVPIEGGALLAHNGVTGTFKELEENDWSDTRTFAEKGIPLHATRWMWEDYDKIKTELRTSRCCMLTETEYQDWNFPVQQQEYEKYGLFSNFSWTPTSTKNRYYQTYNSGYKSLSEQGALNAVSYCIANKMTLAAALHFFAEVCGGFPFSSALEKIYDTNKEMLDTINTHEKIPLAIFDKKKLDAMKDIKSEEDLGNLWVDTQGLVWQEETEKIELRKKTGKPETQKANQASQQEAEEALRLETDYDAQKVIQHFVTNDEQAAIDQELEDQILAQEAARQSYQTNYPMGFVQQYD